MNDISSEGVTLSLEYIGAGRERTFKALGATGKDFSSRRPWVRRITGQYDSGKLQGEFVRGQSDYSEASSTSERGVLVRFPLTIGVYEVKECISWGRDRRYFISVRRGEITEIDRAWVDAYLESRE